MADGLLEKKHAATPRRRQQARQQGQVAVSQDLTSAALLLTAVAALWFFGGAIAAALSNSISQSLSAPIVSGFDIATAASWITQIVGRLAIAAVPILIVMMLAGVLVNLLQTGFIVSPSRVAPKLSNISPRAGLGRIFSVNGVAKFGFGIFKVATIVAVAYAAVRQYGGAVLRLDAMSVPQIVGVLFEALMGTCLWIGGALFLLALADYGFQRWKFEQDLMMTDEELRQEMKETAGDPQLVGRRRELARQFASRSTPLQLSDTDLVLVDRSGWTIAIKYDDSTMAAPTVTASSHGTGDSRIQTAAKQHGIPIHVAAFADLNPKAVVTGQPIPPQLFAFVATALAAKTN